jgi:uncharacterized protein (DUF58 family)
MKNRRPSSFSRFHLTVGGWIFLAVTFVVGVVAAKVQGPMMFCLFGCMLSVMTVSVFIAYRTITVVKVLRELPEHVWQNQTVHIGYYLRNPARHGSCLGLSVQEIAPRGISSVDGYCASLPPSGAFRAGARFVATARGKITLGTLRVGTRFPFGLVYGWRQHSLESALLVWPARGRLKRQLLHAGAVESSTAAPSPATGGQDEFFGLREYRSDDNRRWIHWRRSAGRTLPVVREMAKPAPESLWVILDTYCPGATPAGLELREKIIRFAATLIDYAFERGYRVGLATSFDSGPLVLPARSGASHHSALLDALAQIDCNICSPLPDTIEAIGPGHMRASQAVVISWDDANASGPWMHALATGSSHVRVVTASRLDALYEDRDASSCV